MNGRYNEARRLFHEIQSLADHAQFALQQDDHRAAKADIKRIQTRLDQLPQHFASPSSSVSSPVPKTTLLQTS